MSNNTIGIPGRETTSDQSITPHFSTRRVGSTILLGSVQTLFQRNHLVNDPDTQDSYLNFIVDGVLTRFEASDLTNICLAGYPLMVPLSCTVYDIKENMGWVDCPAAFRFMNTVLPEDVPLWNLGVRDDSLLMIEGLQFPRLQDVVIPTYQHLSECERMCLFEIYRLQAQEGDADEELSGFFRKLASFKNSLETRGLAWMVDHMESFAQIVFWTMKCESALDFTVLVTTAYKLITKKSPSSQILEWLRADDETQGKLDDLRSLRRIMDQTFNWRNSDLCQKLHSVFAHLVVSGFAEHLGFSVEIQDIDKLKKTVDMSGDSRTNLVIAVLDTSIIICERWDAYKLTGDWRCLAFEDTHLTKWVAEADRLINLSGFVGNLKAHGTSLFKFLADLDAAVELGDSITKYTEKANGNLHFVRKKLSSLKLLKNTMVTRQASQQERKAPFGVLVHGTTSIAKSSFVKMLYVYYGRIMGLSVDDHHRFVRSPTDEYWTNFDSSKWCIQLDDIAFLDPAKTSEVDPTLRDLLNVVNNVPYVPPQAALEDKGKTPVMAELVLATSNKSDLNALNYFQCPIAVRRRLPFIVNVVPKPEYCSTDGMIDPTKLPECKDMFPNFWNITVQKLTPEQNLGKESATLTKVKRYTDVREFLKDFAVAAKQHAKNQERAMSADEYMKDLRVCQLCYTVGQCNCVQGFQQWMLFLVIWQLLATVNRLFCYYVLMLFAKSYAASASYRVIYNAIGRYLSQEHEIRLYSMRDGSRKTIKFKKLDVVQCLTVVGLLFVGYKQITWSWKKSKEMLRNRSQSAPKNEPEENKNVENLGYQGNVYGTVASQLQKEETQNVWYNANIKLSTFDFPTPTRSLNGDDANTLRSIVQNNLVRLEAKYMDVSGGMSMGGVFVKGQYLICNAHLFKEAQKIQLTIRRQTGALCDTMTCLVNRSEIQFNHALDLACIVIRNAPPTKDILRFWTEKHIDFSKGVAFKRNAACDVVHFDVHGLAFHSRMEVNGLKHPTPMFLGKCPTETENGDCGTLLFGISPRGCALTGLHTVGYGKSAGYTRILRKDIEDLMHHDYPQLESGEEPTWSVQGSLRLVEPHFKSLVRYIPEGIARVYGTIPGFMSLSKSKVCATPIQKRVCEYFGIEPAHGPPAMSGWEPWRNNLKNMVIQEMMIPQEQINRVRASFSKDILTGLKERYGDEWKKELVFLDDKQSINGLPGVKFIDGMNRSTSMGHPYNTSKSSFLVEDKDEVYPDGVTWKPEIWERVRKIERTYRSGKRCYPIFKGHLKDEAKEIAKILKKKTRLFTAAPADWSTFVRSRLLSFVRLLQKNKSIFEACPGTVAQSVEWTKIYAYLTKHGKDRIVAGDYGLFDKKMIAALILGAFEIIVDVHREAGFSEEEIQDIMGIGFDTAFPVCNIRNDILEFFGTNPSGHPLTVVINSLVNSLYMRLAYLNLNPEKEVETFKKFVSLMTYGDDNVMGVSVSIPWFNHTAIQSYLESIGVTYTMAEKEAESVPFIHIDDVSFLKRAWRWEHELQAHTCPLDEASIHRSLTVWVPSDSDPAEKQIVDVIFSANQEYFFYGREVFEKHHAFFQQILHEEPYCHYAEGRTLPNWATLKQRFEEASRHIGRL